MSDYRDKPWMVPPQYVDDRFVEQVKDDKPTAIDHFNPPDERDASETEELLKREPREERDDYECKDETPINYAKGPHDEEFGVDENLFDRPDDEPVPYENGPNDDEFGLDDDE